MNSKFTDEQIKAYAAQFREGDAIWTGGKWCEVVVNGHFDKLSTKKDCSKNEFIVNGGEELEFKGAKNGFNESSLVQDRYRVTTLEHYELQGGEKVVCLKGTDDLTFGKSYNVFESGDGGRFHITDDVGDKVWTNSYLFREMSEWGIIPRYKQVKNNKPINTDITLTLKDVEKLNQFNSVFHDSKHLVELLDSLGNHEQANELMQNLLSVKEVIDSVDKQRNQIAKELMRKECNL